MRRVDLETAQRETRLGVGQMMGWIIVVTLHQKFGIARQRLDRIFATMTWYNSVVAGMIADKGRPYTMRWLRGKVTSNMSKEDAKAVPLDFRLPVNRRAADRYEEQLLMAGNEAATLVWLIYAAAVREVSGFGAKRLAKLHGEVLANYRDQNEWECADKDIAMERLQKMAEAALGEKLHTEDEPIKKDNPIMRRLAAEEFIAERITAARRELAKPTIPAVVNVAALEVPLVVGNGLRRIYG